MSMLNMATIRSKGRGGAFTKCEEPSVPSSSAPKATKSRHRLGAGRPWKERASSRSPATPEALSSAPVVDLAVGLGVERAGHAQSQMVVVGADHHRLGGGIGRAQNADHVPGLRPLRRQVGRWPRPASRRGPGGRACRCRRSWPGRPRGSSPCPRTGPRPPGATPRRRGCPRRRARRRRAGARARPWPLWCRVRSPRALPSPPGRARPRPSCAGAVKAAHFDCGSSPPGP